MQARARLFGHPVHQMLIVFPLGLLSTAVIFDVVNLATGRAVFSVIAYWLIVAGVIGGLVAAVFGFIDFLSIPLRTRAKRLGALHGIGNVVVTGLFIVSAVLRASDPARWSGAAFVFAVLGVALAGVTGWLGGELVDRLGIGVDDGAHPDAPSSLQKSKLKEYANSRRVETVRR